MTGGDDPAQHLAQDFARRAAKAGPTLARNLLAAELSDDRNEKREWLEQGADRRRQPRSSDRPLCLHRPSLLALEPTGATPRPITIKCSHPIPTTSALCSGVSSSTARPASSAPPSSRSNQPSQESAFGRACCGSTPQRLRDVGRSHRSRRSGQPLRGAALRRHQLLERADRSGRHATRHESGRSLGRSPLGSPSRLLVGARHRRTHLPRARTEFRKPRLLQARARARAGRRGDLARASRSLRARRASGKSSCARCARSWR